MIWTSIGKVRFKIAKLKIENQKYVFLLGSAKQYMKNKTLVDVRGPIYPVFQVKSFCKIVLLMLFELPAIAATIVAFAFTARVV